jgi:hypothetical protein
MENMIYVCNHIFEGIRPILLVCYENEEMSFLCGSPHKWEAGELIVGGINHVVENDPTVIDAMKDLSNGWEAERVKVGSPWLKTKIEPIATGN